MKDKLLSIFTLILFLGGLGSVGWVVGKSYFMRREIAEVGETDCVKERIEKIMTDTSLTGTLDKNQRYQVLLGYYRCNPVQRRELIYFRSSPPTEPIVKRVQGLPGDTFSVVSAESRPGYHLVINGERISGPDGDYYFESQGVPPLKSLEIARQGRLGTNEYLLLTDTSPAFSDSSSFGVIKNTAFEGRAVPIK